MKNSLAIVKLWGSLETIAEHINNIAIPLSHTTEAYKEDQELYDALETLSKRIDKHFNLFKLQVTRK